MKAKGSGKKELYRHTREVLTTDDLNEANILQLLPVAFYICDKDGVITHYNKKAVGFWGRLPAPGETAEELWKGFRLFDKDGRLITGKQNPFTFCVTDHEEDKDMVMIMEGAD